MLQKMKPSGEGKRSKNFEGCVVKISASFSVHTPAETWCPALSQHPLSTLHQRMPARGRRWGVSRAWPALWNRISSANIGAQWAGPSPACPETTTTTVRLEGALLSTSGIFSSCWVSMFFPVTGLCLVYSQKIRIILWRVQIFFSKIFLLHNFLKQLYSKLTSSNMY